MDVDHGTQFLRTQHQLRKSSVAYHPSLFFIHQEAFKACDSLFYGLFHLLNDRSVRKIRDTAVGCKINTCFFFQNSLFLCNDSADGFAGMLNRIVKDRCDSSAGSCPCSGEITVGRNCTAERHCQVSMYVQCSWKNQLSSRIKHFFCICFYILSNGCDLSILHT